MDLKHEARPSAILMLIMMHADGNCEGDGEEMSVFSLFVINKSGGLSYHRDLAECAKFDENDYLRLGSTFHGMHAIGSQVCRCCCVWLWMLLLCCCQYVVSVVGVMNALPSCHMFFVA